MNKSSKHTNFLKAEIQRSEVVTLQKVLIESKIKGNGVGFKKIAWIQYIHECFSGMVEYQSINPAI
jgi:hypothetical protein